MNKFIILMLFFSCGLVYADAIQFEADVKEQIKEKVSTCLDNKDASRTFKCLVVLEQKYMAVFEALVALEQDYKDAFEVIDGAFQKIDPEF